MSYERSAGLDAYFKPVIALATTTAGVLREMDIGAASADHGEYICIKPCIVKRVMFSLVGELAGGTSVAPTVIFKKRPTPLSATNESAVGTITIPDATAIGKVVYKEVNVQFEVGDSMEISHTVGTGTPTGMGYASAECMECPEVPANMSDMIESA